MTDDAPLCCGRPMTGIGVTRGDGVLLRSCSACGRHAWMAGSRELGREELIDLLRDEPPPPAAVPSVPPVPAVPLVPAAPRSSVAASRRARPGATRPAPAPDRRTELQDMLRGFTVHGSSS